MIALLSLLLLLPAGAQASWLTKIAGGAERALQAGLINAIVPADQLEATAMKSARRLAAKPREALLTSRRLLRGNAEQISAVIEEEASNYIKLMASPEAKEAFMAFLEKRPPDFAKARQKSG